MNLTGKRVLVTGGTGFLGRHVCAALEARGAKVFSPTHRQCDLRYAQRVGSVFNSIKPNVVFHLAALCGGIGANQSRPADFGRDNLLMGINVLDACREFGVQKLVLVGSCCSYPRDAPLPLRESDLWAGFPEATNSAYGIAKRTVLALGQSYRAQYGLNVIGIIPANLYGPGDNFDLTTSHVVPAMIRKFLEARDAGQPSVTLWGTGEPTRELLYAEDAAEALVLAAEHYESPEPLNVGSGWEISIHDLAGHIARLIGWPGEILWDRSKPNGQPRRVLCRERARKAFDWSPNTNLMDSLQKTIAWYESERKKKNA